MKYLKRWLRRRKTPQHDIEPGQLSRGTFAKVLFVHCAEATPGPVRRWR